MPLTEDDVRRIIREDRQVTAAHLLAATERFITSTLERQARARLR